MTAGFHGRGARLRLAVVALITAAIATAPVAAAEPPQALVEVRSPALAYGDGARSGSVELGDGCLPEDPALAAVTQRCATAGGPASATLPHTLLGFDATRSAQGGDTDTPLLHDASGARRTVTLRLRVREAGDYQVTMRGLPGEGLEPSAVAGSATQGGETEGAVVTWTAALEAGTHELRAAFDLGPAADGIRFSPEIVVERPDHGHVLAGHWRGNVGALEPVHATHRLVLEQRSGGDAPPSLHTPTFTTVDQGDALAWTVEPGLTANGTHLPTDEPVEAAQELMLSPEMLAEHGITSTGMAFTAMRPPGAAKDRLAYGLRWPELGFHYTVGSPQPVVDPWEQRPLSALYEGDATQSAIIADASPSDRGGAQRPASGPQGQLVLAPNGPVTDAVATLAYSHVDGIDANRADPESLRSACGDATLMAAVSGEVFTLTAEGDVDNTAGTAPIEFAPVRIPHPPGYSRSTVLTLRGGDEQVVEAYELKVTFTDTDTIVTPVVPAGQTFLATGTDDTGRRSWVAHPALTIFYSRTRCPLTPTTGRVQSVPEGSIAALTLHAPDREPLRHTVGPGLWAATTTGGRLQLDLVR